ncbi:MAG: NAD(P)H-hydrate dehydratase [Chitinophagales bacterium]
MRIVNAEEMKTVDRRASEEYGIPSIILMENAGLRVVEVAENLLEKCPGRRVLVVAGKGNNGGDGLVVARHMINSGASVSIMLLGHPDEMTRDTRANYEILDKMNAKMGSLLERDGLNELMLAVLNCDLIIDAMYGISFHGSLGELDSKVVRIINWAKKPVIAVDIPSGVEADTGRVLGEAIKATWTVTLAAPKMGLLVDPGQSYTGTLTVADISIPGLLLNSPEIKNNLITEDLLKQLLVARPVESHKGTYGHVLVVGGSTGLTGAVVLSASSALTSGAGLVTAAVPESLLPIIENQVAEVMTAPLNETIQKAIALEALPAIENLLGTVSVCAIGPGMSRYSEAHAILRAILEKSGIPVVIDADGLNALAEDINIVKNRQIPIVLTPHPGEMARLLGKSIEEVQAKRLELARNAAQEWGVTVVLKGARTIVAWPNGETYLNVTGNPAMATAGSGDVLTGIIAGLIAQGVRPNLAACAGVYLHGRAGDYSKERLGERGTVAGDLVRCLPEVLKAFETR